jgi:hypothetical protein
VDDLRIRVVVHIGWEGDADCCDHEAFLLDSDEAVEDLNGRISEFTTNIADNMREGEYDE